MPVELPPAIAIARENIQASLDNLDIALRQHFYVPRRGPNVVHGGYNDGPGTAFVAVYWEHPEVDWMVGVLEREDANGWTVVAGISPTDPITEIQDRGFASCPVPELTFVKYRLAYQLADTGEAAVAEFSVFFQSQESARLPTYYSSQWIADPRKTV